jgi:hypothetical protein
MMEEMMVTYEAITEQAPYMEKLSIDQNRIVRNNKDNGTAEVLLKEGELKCLPNES